MERATLWHDGVTIELTTPQNQGSWAYDINESGLVVGQSGLSIFDGHAVMWQDGKLVDLNSLRDQSWKNEGWVLVSAKGVNDHGDIVGYARKGDLLRGFVLSPVPEVDSVILVLAGLGVLCQTRWSAKNRRSSAE